MLYGARQVGKTTLVKQLLQPYAHNGRYINCEFPESYELLSRPTEGALGALVGNYQLLVLDEAQRIPNIGLLLKLLVDHFPQCQVIATGSSAFDLSNKITEPLTGRSFQFMLFPLAFSELRQQHDLLALNARLEQAILYGLYPGVFGLGRDMAIEVLQQLAGDYIYKDILAFERLRKAGVVRDLLALLALQLGAEVSINELATQLGINRLTIERYLDLLEQTFVIYRLRAYSRNPRKEISKSIKIYFYDCGIRNAIINNFNPLSLRNDVGALWENLCMTERFKYHQYQRRQTPMYFWRTFAQQEIDLVEDSEGELSGFEFKWSPNQRSNARAFQAEYPNSNIETIHRENYAAFMGVVA